MVTLSLTVDQVVDLVQQLPPDQKRRVLAVLAADAQARREERMTQAEHHKCRFLCGRLERPSLRLP